MVSRSIIYKVLLFLAIIGSVFNMSNVSAEELSLSSAEVLVTEPVLDLEEIESLEIDSQDWLTL